MAMATPDSTSPSAEVTSTQSRPSTAADSAISETFDDQDGTLCYGDERQALTDYTKFFNNPSMSDVKLRVGDITYHAHKMVLIRSSDVFDRMLSGEWSDSARKEVELVEPYECIEVFPRFLKFLYGCHVVLNRENALPVLVLADKYNVADLRQVCIRHAVKQIIPKLQLKEVFHVWFQYATKCYHKPLISACVQSLAGRMDDIMSSDEWEQEWTNLDQDQLVEFLCSSDLRIKDEFELFRAVERWLNASGHPERRENLEVRLKVLLQHIRFPMMAPEQLCEVEMSKLVHQFPHLFVTLLLQAYKFHCLPLTGRAANKDFRTSNYLLRNYTALGWNHRVVIRGFHELAKNCELTSRFQTRASAYPQTVWDWELKIFPKGATNFDEFRAVLQANLILDQCRPIEFYISLVDNDQILRAVAGRKNFTKSRYTADTEIEKAVALAELNAPDSELLCGEHVILQIMIRPVQ
ncbi:BTB/POZ domain-containing protein 17-like isoform X2 [Branchiostoma lanceolatum]|uniref:BTB/POZ domain-containing protein 17-like isoform X2 n=1 Tax=Branchiostoma lanceolatum TaxID=7740 RepID=UPI0034537424